MKSDVGATRDSSILIVAERAGHAEYDHIALYKGLAGLQQTSSHVSLQVPNPLLQRYGKKR
jgi:hypothetical protein